MSHDLETIRAAMCLQSLCEADGIVFRTEGPNVKAPCPFHAERSGSFTIHGASPQRAHCYGCGWSGDVFAYWCEQHGYQSTDKDGFKQAVEALAQRAGIAALAQPAKKTKPAPAAPVATTLVDRRRPWLPPMRQLRPAEIQQLAALRGLSIAALEAAIDDQRLGYSLWPVTGDGPDHRSHPSWCITDPERWVAQFRRLDGGLYEGVDGNNFKSYSTKNVCWPVGAAQTGDSQQIILVEGGADMLAAYHLLHATGQLDTVVVWCLFGASVRLCTEALQLARGRRVRIFADNDAPQTKTFKHRPPITIRPGLEGAARWVDQLRSAGAAAVDVYDLQPLGDEIGDLNDLVKAGTDDLDLDHLLTF
jgi:hypothetical protein